MGWRSMDISVKQYRAEAKTRFRAHAEELRALSAAASFPAIKAQLFEIAEQYDSLAAQQTPDGCHSKFPTETRRPARSSGPGVLRP